MPKLIPMHEVNCRVLQDKDGRVMLDLASRREPVTLRKSWISLRTRKPNPRNPHGAASMKKYPMTLKMPLALAKQEGIA